MISTLLFFEMLEVLGQEFCWSGLTTSDQYRQNPALYLERLACPSGPNCILFTSRETKIVCRMKSPPSHTHTHTHTHTGQPHTYVQGHRQPTHGGSLRAGQTAVTYGSLWSLDTRLASCTIQTSQTNYALQAKPILTKFINIGFSRPTLPPAGPGSPALPFSPSLPTSPGRPCGPSCPGFPDSPGVPAIPSLPGLPGLPVDPTLPGGPEAPGGPSVPGIPAPPGDPLSPGEPESP